MEGKNVIYPPNYDGGLFADALKDLRNVKQQLYSAAEHFEDSYHKNHQKEMVLESLKDYISKSLIKTIDHLGSVSYKLNNFLHHNLNQVSTLNLQVLCIDQRLRTSQAFANKVGLSHQSLTTQTPKYPNKHIVPEGCVSEGKSESSVVGKGYGEQASSETPGSWVDFSFTKAAVNKRLEKRSRSVSHLGFRNKRSESASSSVDRSTSPNISRSCYSLYPQRERAKDMEVYSKKTSNLFKVLFNMYKSKNHA